MPRLAIIISAVGTTEALEGTLVSVLENRPADCEIMVALNRPYSDPYDLKDEVRLLAPAGRAATIDGINRALATTRAPFVHLLSSGCTVSEGWADEALARFGDRQVASVAPLVWDAASRDRILAAGVGYRASGKRYLIAEGLHQLSAEVKSSVVGAGGFAAFYRKAALDFVGGFSAQLGPQQADIDLAIVLRRAGFAAAVEPKSQVFALAEADPREEAFRQALHEERLFWRNLPTAGRAGALGRHLGAVALELLGSFARPRMIAQFTGRGLACCQLISHARHRRMLGELGRRALRPKVTPEHVRIDNPHSAVGRGDTTPNQVRSR